MLSFIRTVLRIANVLNWATGLLLICFAIATFFASDFLVTNMTQDFGGSEEKARVAIYWVRVSAGLIIFIIPAAHVVLTKLIKMIDSIAAGESFSTSNVSRLRQIAWALLVINIVDLGFGVISFGASEASGEYFGWSLSVTSWFAVLMLFVLARIFKEGAAMREELEGTI